MNIYVVILSIIVAVFAILMMNLVRKVEVLENDSLNKDIILTDIEKLVKNSLDNIEKISENFELENDEELGFIFKFHKEVIGILNEYFL